jgi:hypothetical protein
MVTMGHQGVWLGTASTATRRELYVLYVFYALRSREIDEATISISFLMY